MSPSSSMPGRPTQAADLSDLAGLKLGNYRLEQLVGRGRMGVVYRAKDEALLRPTAVKVLSWNLAEAQGQDPVQWFLAEARLVARINHPRVVQIYGAARQGDYCYIAMEYIAGESVESLVTRNGAMRPEAALDVLLQAASALHAAHASGVVHRDVKPGNLLVGPGGLTKLGDFGMALGPPDVRIGNARLRVGTPYYTAPEIWRGESASPSSDVYSLGATFFHLLTGRPPYPGADITSVEQGHLRAPVPDPREIVRQLPASCAALAQRALAKTPEGRHASAQEVLWEGRRVLHDLAAAANGRQARPLALPTASAAARPDGPAAPRRPAAGLLAESFGFVRRPFADVDPADWPYRGDPLASARLESVARLDRDHAPVVAITGGEGSGRTTLSRGVAAELGASRLVLSVDLLGDAGGRTLLQRLCRATSAVEATPAASLDALVERLSEERQHWGVPPLLVLDGAQAPLPSGAELGRLLGAARGTRSFQVLLVGRPGLSDALARAVADLGGEPVPEISLRPLARAELAGYVHGWIRATRPPAAPPIIVSPDALLLVGLRSDGALERVNRIAENMLVLAASERQRTLVSWHAWAASDRERWADARAAVALPPRPRSWPPAEVADVIDACRRGAGLPPRPRQEEGRA